LKGKQAEFISASTGFYGCRFIIATYSPALPALKDAVIYDLDNEPVVTRKWTELGNLREMLGFFEEHRQEFLEK
jgi:predicted ATPase